MFLIDTNVISEVRKRGQCDRRVAQWYADCSSEQLYLSVLVLGEIWQGISALAHRDGAQSSDLSLWYRRLKSAFAGRILGLSEGVVAGAARAITSKAVRNAEDEW